MFLFSFHNPGIDGRTSRMLSECFTIRAISTEHVCRLKVVTLVGVSEVFQFFLGQRDNNTNPKSYQNRFSNPKRYDDPSPRFLYMGVPTRIYVPLIKLSQILHEHVYIAIKLKSAVKHFIRKSRHVNIKKAVEVI